MSERRPLHRDRRTWTALIAMLAAIGAYVLTLDDSDESAEVAPPAAAAP